MSELDTGALGPGRIEPRELEQEMRSSFLDYAMSVIVSRALPDVRDGLKPVHRRVLYSMWTNGNRPGRPYVKSANIVGYVMGNFHPHGDSAIYDTLVRMAQPFSLRYPLVDGQGNFGSIDDDPAAAMRYCVSADTRVATPEGTRPDRLARRPRWRLIRATTSTSRCSTASAGRFTRRSSSTPATTRRCGCARARATSSRARTTTRCSASSTWPACRCCSGSCSKRSQPGDRVAASRARRGPSRLSSTSASGATALLLGAFVSEGFVSRRIAPASTTSTATSSTAVVDAYDAVVGGRRYVYERHDRLRQHAAASSTSRTSTRSSSEPARRAASACAEREKRVPERVWRGSRRRSSASSCRRSSPATARRRCCRGRRSRSRTRRTASSSRRTSSCCCSSSVSSPGSAATRRARSRS